MIDHGASFYFNRDLANTHTDTCAKCGDKIVYPDDLRECEWCEDYFCDKHDMHYSDCPCCGPGACGKVTDEEEKE